MRKLARNLTSKLTRKPIGTKMNLFDIVAQDLLKPLTSKYKETYIACLMLIYNTYRTEMSFGVDREVVVSQLEQFFEAQADGGSSAMVFDEN
jgi:hypothetical protein